MSKPVISIIIATFNSEKTLPLVLKALRDQSFPSQKLEVLLVDGGSKDNTFKIGKEYACTIINNPRTEPVYAKFLGYTRAKGKYIVYLDHDEVLQNKDSLKIKYECLVKEKDVKAVLVSGYENPPGYPFINEYINEFGDPFSFFIYRLSKSSQFFIKQMKARYGVKKETKEYALLSLKGITQMPIIELCAAGSMTDREYMMKEFPETLTRSELIPHFFYLLHSKMPTVAITKKDSILHYSSDVLRKYLNKIRWRIKNNIYHIADMGMSGFTGRIQYDSSWNVWKKYLFIPYTFLLLPVLIDSVYLIITRKKVEYFLHFPLCVFTASLIMYHSVKKILGSTQLLKSYDESTVIKTK